MAVLMQMSDKWVWRTKVVYIFSFLYVYCILTNTCCYYTGQAINAWDACVSSIFYDMMFIGFLILKIEHSNMTAHRILFKKINHALQYFVLNVKCELVCPLNDCSEDIESVIRVQNPWTLTTDCIHHSVDLLLNMMLGQVNVRLNMAVFKVFTNIGVWFINIWHK